MDSVIYQEFQKYLIENGIKPDYAKRIDNYCNKILRTTPNTLVGQIFHILQSGDNISRYYKDALIKFNEFCFEKAIYNRPDIYAYIIKPFTLTEPAQIILEKGEIGLLDAKDAARALNISRKTFDRLYKNKPDIIKRVIHGGKPFYTVASLNEYLRINFNAK